MRPLLFLAVLPCVFLAGLAACRNPSTDEFDGEADAASTTYTGPAPLVIGTVVDARSGKPIAGAVVRGPGGLETKSDARGRFTLRGLVPGTSGELVATSEAGLSGKNVLRPLEGGPLEIVIHLR
jgi:hypothetical protein